MKLVKLFAVSLVLMFSALATQAAEVEMRSAVLGIGGGCYGQCRSLSVDVLVDNLAFEKQVSIHYTIDQGETWFTAQAQYNHALDNNKELWSMYTNLGGTSDISVEFYVTYDVNGTQYLDSNNGHNYRSNEVFAAFNPKEVEFVAARKGVGLGCYGLCGDLTVDVQVKNLAYEKDVFLVYSVDGGEWLKSLAGTFQLDNQDGTELWSIYLSYIYPRDAQVQFAIGYTVNGVTYWDNNNGMDYLY